SHISTLSLHAALPIYVDALDRLDVGMDVADLDADVLKVVGQVLRHLLGERRDEDALVHLDALANLVQEVVDLIARRTHTKKMARSEEHTSELQSRFDL